MSGSRRHPKVRMVLVSTAGIQAVYEGLGSWSEHSRSIGKFLSKAGCLFLRERACWAAGLLLYESIGSCQKRLHIQQIRGRRFPMGPSVPARRRSLSSRCLWTTSSSRGGGLASGLRLPETGRLDLRQRLQLSTRLALAGQPSEQSAAADSEEGRHREGDWLAYFPAHL